MAKRYMLVLISIICIVTFTACAAIPAQATAAQPAAPASQSTAASASPAPSAASTKPASATPEASASTTSSESEDPGFDLENIINEDSLNKNYQSFMKVPGENIEATIVHNTLTFMVTLDKDIKKADFTADMQTKHQQDLQNQIDILAEQYDGLIDCTFIYNLMSKSGEMLMSITQEYKEPK